MAEQIVKDIQDAGGFITLTDLRGYRAIERGPLRTTVNRTLEMLSTPPPGSGPLISLALKIMTGELQVVFVPSSNNCLLCAIFLQANWFLDRQIRLLSS